jgi:hypothetical protein
MRESWAHKTVNRPHTLGDDAPTIFELATELPRSSLPALT